MKNERKPEIKYSNCYETLYIIDSEEESNSSNDESTTPEYSSDNPAFRKKRKSKRIKTDKRNTSEKYIDMITKKDHRKQLRLLLIVKLDNRKTQYQDKR